MKKLSLALLITSLLPGLRADITTGLVGYWNLAAGPGSSTVADLSGNGNTGTLKNYDDTTYNNMWTANSDPTNGWPYALNFTNKLAGFGTNTYVAIPDSTSLDSCSANKQWTLSAWFNCSVAGGSEPNNAGLIAKGNQNLEAFAVYFLAGKVVTIFHNAAGTGTETVTNTTIPVAGAWYHLAITVLEPKSSATAEAIIYINGVRESLSNPNTYTTVYSTNLPVTIGCRAGATGNVTNAFLGTLDEVRIYNRALSASDVSQLYDNQAFSIINHGIGYWNGLASSGGNATLDAISANFSTNVYTSPLGVATNLANVLAVEQAESLQLGCVLADAFYSNSASFTVASTNLNLAPGGVALGTASGPGTLTFINSALRYSLNSSDANGLKDGDANPTALALSGSGTAILTGTNTFSGGSTINVGTLQIGNGSGGAATGLPLGSGLVANNGALLFNVNDSPPAFANAISGGGTLTMSGSGTVALTGASTYTGNTVLNSGTLNVNSVGDSGTSAIGAGSVTLSGGTLAYSGTGETTARQFSGVAGTTSTIDVPGGVTLTLNGRVTGASSSAFTVNKIDAGTLVLGNSADNSYFGMNINGGTVILNTTSASGVHGLGSTSSIGNGATLQLSGSGGYDIYSTVALTVNSGGVLDGNGQSDGFTTLNLSGTGIGGTGALINSDPSDPAMLTVAVNLAANATIGGPGMITLPGVVSGAGMLTYAGSGTLQLQGANSYTGGAVVTSGTLDGYGANSLPGNVTVAGTGVLELDDSAAMSSVGVLALPASPAANSVILTYSGSQTISLLYIGSTAIPGGTYGAAGSGAANTNAAFTGIGILTVTGPAYWDAAHADASPGGGGTGNWDTTTSTDWFTGSTDTPWATDAVAFFAGTAGMVTLATNLNADGLTFITPGYSVTNTDGVSVLTLDGNNPVITVPAGNTAMSCMIAESGTSPLAINGSGELTLGGANSFSGGLTINSATVSATAISDSGASAIGTSGAVTIQGGGTLSYAGAAAANTARAVTANGAATSYLDVPAGSLTFSGQVKSGVGSTGQIFTKTSAGTLILAGADDNTSLTMAINQGEVIINKASGASVHGLGGGTSTLASGAELQLSGTGTYDLYSGCILMVSSGGLFDLGGQTTDMSTLTISGAGFGGGALVNSVTNTTSMLTNAGSGLVLAGPTTMGGPGNITLISAVSGTGPVTYAGTGTLTLSEVNTYGGGTSINPGGTVLLNNSATSASSGTITLNTNGTLDVGIVGNNIILPNAISGPGTVNLMETANDNLQLGGSMAGFTGTLNCLTSPGGTAKAQILTTAVSLSSAATVNIAAGGTLYVANSGVTIPCPVNIYGLGNSEAYGALRIENGALISGPVMLYSNTTMGNAQSGVSKLATISGPISQSNGIFGITFTAEPGTIVLAGTNTYGGATTISGGELEISGAGQLGGGNYAAPITNNSVFAFASSAAQALSGVVSGTGVLAQGGPGILTLTGANTYTGGTLITNSSVLLIAGSGCLGASATTTNYPGAITNYGTLDFASSTPQNLSGVVSGTGTLVQSGSGTLTLDVGNTYTGPTLVTNGATLALASSGSISTTSSVNLGPGTTLDVSAYGLSFSLGGVTTLIASGDGTGVGSTAATLEGGAGATVTVGALTFNFTSQSFSGDANHPALFVSSGALNLSGSGLTVSNAAATPLGAGIYTLVQVAGGTLNVASTNVTITGTGLAAGTAASLAVSGGSLNLVVITTVVPMPTVNNVTLSGSSLIFSGTNGSDGGNYYVLTTTNLALPRSQWTSIATNAFGPTGAFSVTNPIGANPGLFYSIEIP